MAIKIFEAQKQPISVDAKVKDAILSKTYQFSVLMNEVSVVRFHDKKSGMPLHKIVFYDGASQSGSCSIQIEDNSVKGSPKLKVNESKQILSYPNLDYEISENSVKETLILHQKPARNYIDYTIRRRGECGIEFDIENSQIKLYASSNKDFDDGEQFIAGVVKKPILIDDDGSKYTDIKMEVYEIEPIVKSSGGNESWWRVRYIIDSEWLASAKYPIKFDPPISLYDNGTNHIYLAPTVERLGSTGKLAFLIATRPTYAMHAIVGDENGFSVSSDNILFTNTTYINYPMLIPRVDGLGAYVGCAFYYGSYEKKRIYSCNNDLTSAGSYLEVAGDGWMGMSGATDYVNGSPYIVFAYDKNTSNIGVNYTNNNYNTYQSFDAGFRRGFPQVSYDYLNNVFVIGAGDDGGMTGHVGVFLTGANTVIYKNDFTAVISSNRVYTARGGLIKDGRTLLFYRGRDSSTNKLKHNKMHYLKYAGSWMLDGEVDLEALGYGEGYNFNHFVDRRGNGHTLIFGGGTTNDPNIYHFINGDTNNVNVIYTVPNGVYPSYVSAYVHPIFRDYDDRGQKDGHIVFFGIDSATGSRQIYWVPLNEARIPTPQYKTLFI